MPPKKLPVAVTKEEFVKLVRVTKYPKHKLAWLLGFGSGLRISEITNLQPRNINLKEKKILIEEGKGKKDRVVPLPKGFKDYHLKMLPMGIGVRTLQISFKRACERAGLLKIKPNLHFHSLRHGFATNCIKSGMNIDYVKLLLGHTNVATTSIYLQSEPKDALDKYEELF